MPDPPPGPQVPFPTPPAVTSLMQKDAGLIQVTPVKLAVFWKLWDTPANGSPMMSYPGRTWSIGCPPWNVIRLLTDQPCVRILGPCEEPGMSQVTVAEKFWRVSKSPLPYSAFRFLLSYGKTPRYAVISSSACAQV